MFHDEVAALRLFAQRNLDVHAFLVFGSVARGDATARSDLDVAFITASRRADAVDASLSALLEQDLPIQVRDPRRPKRVLFSPDLHRRVEAFVLEDVAEIERYVRGTRLADPASAVLFDRTGAITERLRGLAPEEDAPDAEVDRHLRRFQLAFERGSRYHAASDAYRAHFEFGIAFESLARCAWLGAGQRGFVFLPRQLLQVVSPELREAFAPFENHVDPARQHATKRALLELLRVVLASAARDEPGLCAFCDEVLARDRFWNHRDAAEHVDDRLRRGVLFRGASPHHHAAEPEYSDWLSARKIRLRIDLRAAFERERDPVRLSVPSRLCPVDPWNELERWDPLRGTVSPIEGSYRFTALRSGAVLRDVVRTVLARNPVLIHCHAGRDRTGVVVGLLQYLVGAAPKGIVHGFSLHADAERTGAFSRVLAYLDANGGRFQLAQRSEISPDELEALTSLLWRTP
jgi:predicted nucleotidyltransferase